MPDAPPVTTATLPRSEKSRSTTGSVFMVILLVASAVGGRLVVGDRIDFRRGGRRRVELVVQPLPGQPAGQLDPDDALAEAQHLRVVGQDGAFDREAVMG